MAIRYLIVDDELPGRLNLRLAMAASGQRAPVKVVFGLSGMGVAIGIRVARRAAGLVGEGGGQRSKAPSSIRAARKWSIGLWAGYPAGKAGTEGPGTRCSHSAAASARRRAASGDASTAARHALRKS